MMLHRHFEERKATKEQAEPVPLATDNVQAKKPKPKRATKRKTKE